MSPKSAARMDPVVIGYVQPAPSGGADNSSDNQRSRDSSGVVENGGVTPRWREGTEEGEGEDSAHNSLQFMLDGAGGGAAGGAAGGGRARESVLLEVWSRNPTKDAFVGSAVLQLPPMLQCHVEVG